MSLLFGLIVGFSLGLTGGGGSIFAVPLLVYGLDVPVQRAVLVSLAAVGSTTLIGAATQLRHGAADLRTGLLFGVAGCAGAPFGAWLNHRLPGRMLLTGFALLMILIAVRLWQRATRVPQETQITRATAVAVTGGPSCRFDGNGRLQISSRCGMVLTASGIATGVLSGLFGVGGGFLIVPALLFVAALPIHRAVATSLITITLVSFAGVVAHWLAGQRLDWPLTAQFVGGGLLGMGAGIRLGQRLAGPLLQRLFAAGMVAVAAYMLIRI
jgi:hypothetical protein